MPWGLLPTPAEQVRQSTGILGCAAWKAIRVYADKGALGATAQRSRRDGHYSGELPARAETFLEEAGRLWGERRVEATVYVPC